MSAAKAATDADAPRDYRIKSGPWANAWKIAAAIGVLGLVGAGAGFASDARRFAFSYLFAFIFFLTLALGGMFFVLIQHLTSANWSVTVRRTAEFFMAAIPVFALLFIPVVATGGHVFPWLHPATESAHEAEHAGTAHAGVEHGEDAEHGEPVVTSAAEASRVVGRPDEEQAQTLSLKKGYLNQGFFVGRAVFYFLMWFLISRRLFKLSTDQDASKDPQNTVLSQRMAPWATFVFALTLTFAGFDWIMSLNPMWYSTIFGVWIFAGAAVSIHAIVTVITLSFRSQNLTGEAINVEHFHDLGKLTFGFLVFWAYISFSQFFLTWYASIPEETVFYHHRWGEGPWRTVSLAIILVQFALPFFLLLSRNTKRVLNFLWIPCAIILVMHVVECYWMILPNFGRNVFETAGESVLFLSWIDAACFLGVGGVYLAVVFWLMTRHPLIPVGDPRLNRSLRFENA